MALHTTVPTRSDRIAALDAASLQNLHRLTGDPLYWLELETRCTGPASDPAALAEAVASFPGLRSLGQHRHTGTGIGSWNGRTAHVEVGPGIVRLVVRDLARVDAAQERDRQREAIRRALVEQAGSRTFNTPGVGVLDAWDAPAPSRTISEWSSRSRNRMRQAFASVDFGPLQESGHPLAMVTLTYPGDWLAVAPSGKVVKAHLRALQMRYKRAVGIPLRGAWKLEFQRRGAPHFHVLMPVPAMVKGRTFEAWLSDAWADIVSAGHCGCTGGGVCCERARHVLAGTGVDFGTTARSTDPRRLGIYFLKHSTKDSGGKEYQHNVPREWLCDENGEATPDRGPGRFWGFWGLPKLVEAVELDAADLWTAKRTLRRVADAKARAITYQRARAQGASVRDAMCAKVIRNRAFKSARPVGGFLICNNGETLARDLARAVRLARVSRV